MAGWIDVLSLIVTLSLIAAVVLGIIYVMRAMSSVVESTKESLKTKGVDLSKGGMSVKTHGRYNREDYLDATQRHLMKALHTSKFGASAKGTEGRTISSHSSDSDSLIEKKKNGVPVKTT
ncbi:hypothetical protein SCP_0801500 [Sparassis crispa]|uniref:Uncharacterized protein n=1 Tax=Sparassis crispa TaxID=139825 RepID=A0A401GTS1_9APHY|nr:hypothetical protein SCP_0801500 [Sparassis crispa]GBE85631.1 hypothetical protein SCP_0801500 [Sparassis crispa]